MSKNRKPLPIIEKLELIDTGSEGQSVGRSDGMAVFVKNAVPGDIADIQLTRKKNKYAEGKAIHFHKFSEKRADPLCIHFGVCGGCKWQNMKYEEQLQFKQKQVHNALVRIGHLDIPPIQPIIGSKEVYYYRNKLEFTFSNKMWLTEEQIRSKAEFSSRNALGFHIPGLFDKVMDVQECHLQAGPSNVIRESVKRFALQHNLSFFDIREQSGLLRNLIIRTASTGEVMVIVVFHHEEENNKKLLGHLALSFPQITSLMYVINGKRNDTISDLEVHNHSGASFIHEKMEDLTFRISPKSFYQTNSLQAYELYKVAREFAGIQPGDTVYDLYTGTGTIANFVARQAKKAVGIEYVEAAIEDARINSGLNGITNTAFFAGDMKNVLSDELAAAQGRPDVIITDPPRAGMAGEVVQKMLDLAPRTIVYVSCNPATQARDLEWMKEQYTITHVQPVDMFPHTAHVENVVRLVRK
jgi:23S rRNA (uracil1939-C5)-methyltransferase